MGKTIRTAPPPLTLAGTALFLDYDGTLVAIAATPEAASADEEVRALLTGLDRALAGGLAIVSGRPVGDIDGFLAPLRLTVAGLHGLELRGRDGRHRTAVGAETALEPVRAAFAALAARHPGTLLEDKRLTMAFHYRGAPAAGAEAETLAARLVAESGGDLQLLPGKMVVELLPAGRDKGRAVEELRRRPEFAGRRPVFVGDDVTDEAGFRAANRLGGLSIMVGTIDRDSAAIHQLEDVAQLRAWLAAGLQASS